MGNNKHTHSSFNQKERKSNLLLVTVLNFIITLAEVAGGLISNSLSLLSDAIHNFGDTLAILLAFVASKIGNRGATEKKTFGYKRAEILAALLNSMVLVVITIFLFVEAYKRFLSPEPVKGRIMFAVAVVGLLGNLFSILLLRHNTGKNLNIRAAYLHLLGDTISSVAVIAGSLLIYFYNIFWIDPVVTVLIGVYILKEAFAVLKETVDILMQGTPASIDITEVVKAMEQFGQISNVHHVHTWKLDDKQIHFECHVDLDKNLLASDADLLRLEIEEMLKKKFRISHVTIQFEYNCCMEKSIIHKHQVKRHQ